ncbi:uncharacterized protein LOC120534702 [Polypterus senegalus]|uniref:uncharacterized protein LOC120534702 n=1 Tax=Polypterus senegalus TaxID=55291 RepID=UPI001962E6F3|nr:uncharacterized protein LOC120534702 [Polypterus senegalus]
MEKKSPTVQGPHHETHKYEEGISEVQRDKEETNPTLPWGLLLMNGIEVDEEHCIWRSGDLEQECVCIKEVEEEEDYDSGPLDFTVDSELMSYITKQKKETVDSLKEEDLKQGSDRHCVNPDEEGPGLGCTPSGHCSIPHHSVNMTHESDMNLTGSSPSGEGETHQTWHTDRYSTLHWRNCVGHVNQREKEKSAVYWNISMDVKQETCDVDMSFIENCKY